MGKTKTLFIVRHGKSSWDNNSLSDIDRPLKERGIIDAYSVADKIKNNNLIPQLLITSSAIRALHTATIFARVLGINKENIVILKDLYQAETEKIIQIIRSTSNEVDSLMIFGHNPGFTDVVNKLSNLSLGNLPTSGLVKIVFKVDKWKRIDKVSLVDESYEFPLKT